MTSFHQMENYRLLSVLRGSDGRGGRGGGCEDFSGDTNLVRILYIQPGLTALLSGAIRHLKFRMLEESVGHEGL